MAAVIGPGNIILFAAANDIADSATMQGENAGKVTGPYRIRVSAIHAIFVGATSIVIKNGGTSGTVIFAATGGANTTQTIAFGAPQELEDLAVTTITAGNTVVAFLAN